MTTWWPLPWRLISSSTLLLEDLSHRTHLPLRCTGNLLPHLNLWKFAHYSHENLVEFLHGKSHDSSEHGKPYSPLSLVSLLLGLFLLHMFLVHLGTIFDDFLN